MRELGDQLQKEQTDEEWQQIEGIMKEVTERTLEHGRGRRANA